MQTHVLLTVLHSNLYFTFLLLHVVVFSVFLLQDLKPGNLAVNEDCELKVPEQTQPNCPYF